MYTHSDIEKRVETALMRRPRPVYPALITQWNTTNP